MGKEIVYYIDGDGIGPEVNTAARKVLDEAVKKTYSGENSLEWKEVFAGEKAYQEKGEYLPQESLRVLEKKANNVLKGPLTTPVGAGFRSLNVALRQIFDLYACIRPVRYFPGIQSPVKNPEKVDMVVFRENTEDVYAGIEWEAESPEAKKLISYIREELHSEIDPASGVGIKPITENGSKRLVRKALNYAIEHSKPSTTLVHKGNIMKFTEGAFMNWGYEVARDEFGSYCHFDEDAANSGNGILVNDRIADNMFQQILTRPDEYSVIATTNLNGDYISDALAAQVGGLGIAPGANIGDDLAVFEATHGTVPKRAGTDSANPCSLILSGAMMLDHLGWYKASTNIHQAIEKTILSKKVTGDLARQIQGSSLVGCSELSDLICSNLD